VQLGKHPGPVHSHAYETRPPTRRTKATRGGAKVLDWYIDRGTVGPHVSEGQSVCSRAAGKALAQDEDTFKTRPRSAGLRIPQLLRVLGGGPDGETLSYLSKSTATAEEQHAGWLRCPDSPRILQRRDERYVDSDPTPAGRKNWRPIVAKTALHRNRPYIVRLCANDNGRVSAISGLASPDRCARRPSTLFGGGTARGPLGSSAEVGSREPLYSSRPVGRVLLAFPVERMGGERYLRERESSVCAHPQRQFKSKTPQAFSGRH